MITVKPFGGLGNRLRVLYSVLALNEQLNNKIKIIWDCSHELNCPFDELFNYPDYCSVKNIKQGLVTKAKKYAQRKFDTSGILSLRYDVIISNKEAKKLRERKSDLVQYSDNRKIYIETCYDFFLNWSNVNFFEPKSEIQHRADAICQTFDSSTYGIHIRRTDNRMSRKYSPSSAFKKVIREKIESDERARFFLATDSTEIREEFVKEFQDKVILSENKILDRNSSEGIKNALIDMICLSKTKKIYGSYGSSFSAISAVLSGIECENVFSEEFQLS